MYDNLVKIEARLTIVTQDRCQTVHSCAKGCAAEGNTAAVYLPGRISEQLYDCHHIL